MIDLILIFTMSFLAPAPLSTEVEQDMWDMIQIVHKLGIRPISGGSDAPFTPEQMDSIDRMLKLKIIGEYLQMMKTITMFTPRTAFEIARMVLMQKEAAVVATWTDSIIRPMESYLQNPTPEMFRELYQSYRKIHRIERMRRKKP